MISQVQWNSKLVHSILPSRDFCVDRQLLFPFVLYHSDRSILQSLSTADNFCLLPLAFGFANFSLLRSEVRVIWAWSRHSKWGFASGAPFRFPKISRVLRINYWCAMPQIGGVSFPHVLLKFCVYYFVGLDRFNHSVLSFRILLENRIHVVFYFPFVSCNPINLSSQHI